MSTTPSRHVEVEIGALVAGDRVIPGPVILSYPLSLEHSAEEFSHVHAGPVTVNHSKTFPTEDSP